MQYATPAELAHWLNPDADPTPDPPENATPLLRAASQLVRNATLGALYATDGDGLPTDGPTRTAMREATLEQAAAWHLAGIDPRKGPTQVPRRVQSKTLGPASTTYVADPSADGYLSALASGQSLVLSAWMILRNAGLIVTGVSTGTGGLERFNIDQRYYDPLTGVLEP